VGSAQQNHGSVSLGGRRRPLSGSSLRLFFTARKARHGLGQLADPISIATLSVTGARRMATSL
jgi:hypothetical protein